MYSVFRFRTYMTATVAIASIAMSAISANAQNTMDLIQSEDALMLQCYGFNKYVSTLDAEKIPYLHPNMTAETASQDTEFYLEYLKGFGADVKKLNETAARVVTQMAPMIKAAIEDKDVKAKQQSETAFEMCTGLKEAWTADKCESGDYKPTFGVRISLQQIPTAKLCREIEASSLIPFATRNEPNSPSLASFKGGSDPSAVRLAKLDDLLSRQGVAQCPSDGPSGRYGGGLSATADDIVADARYSSKSSAEVRTEDQSSQQAAYQKVRDTCDRLVAAYDKWYEGEPEETR